MGVNGKRGRTRSGTQAGGGGGGGGGDVIGGSSDDLRKNLGIDSPTSKYVYQMKLFFFFSILAQPYPSYPSGEEL